MVVRRRGDDKQANGSANGSTNGTIKPLQAYDAELKTDHSRWRMKNVDGRQTWHYLQSDEQAKAWPMTAADKYYLGQDTGAQTLPKATTPLQAAENGLAFYSRLQLEPGNWGCEYGGPMFLLPGMTIALYSTDLRLSRPEEQEVARYILSMQNIGSRNDGAGGWGLHTAGDSTVFGTAMNYTALRLLGISAEDPRMRKARSCLYEMGGAINGPHWAKFWLSVLGVMDWDVVNPVPPELWLLPDWTPISPWRWWIHMRQVYLPMGHIWSKKWTYPRADTDPLIKELRQELFTQPHAEIRWPRFRNAISPHDNYNPKSWLLNAVNWLLVMFWIPYLRIDWLVKRAEAWTWKLIQIEDKNTNYAALAPVNSPMNLMCCFIEEGPDAESVRLHREHIHDFLWMSEGGMMMNGTDGVQTWDTAFTIQAVVAAGLADDARYRPMMEKALSFLESQQFTGHPHGYEESSVYSDPPTARTSPEAGYRQARRGAWGFSTRSQGYTVSDCTSEALKAILELQALPSSKGAGKVYPELMNFERLRWAADIILTMQNDTGGIASYEIRRGSERLEYLNAAEVFGRIMVEYDYPECTTSCVTAMHLFSEAFPDYRREDIAIFQSRAVEWIRTNQRADGSWYGSWAICFTYAAMFALESLKLQGEVYSNSERVRRACKFLVDHQNEDGGWGESFKSCETGEWCDHPDGSQVVNTAWTVIALLEAGYSDRAVLDKAVALLMRRQQGNGEWLQEGIEGVFNKSCMISYPNYKFIFPIKALGMYARRIDNSTVKEN